MSFQAFMRKDRKDKRDQVVDLIVSEDFKDDKGEVIPFKIKSITFDEFTSLREKHSTVEIIYNGGKKLPIKKTNDGRLIMDLCSKSIVYPNLKDKELQDFYGVMNEYDLVDAMLNMQEMSRISDKVMEISGINEDINEVKEEAKN